MVDILFVVPALEPVLKEESIGTLILANKVIASDFSASIIRYWEIEGNQTDYLKFSNAMTKRIVEEKPKVVDFYCRCTEYHISIDLAKRIKQADSSIIIAFGGPQAEAVSVKTLEKYSCVDYICCSEGENTIVPFLKFTLNKNVNHAGVQDVKGLVYRDDDGIIVHNAHPELLPDNYVADGLYYSLIPEKIFANSSWATVDVGRGCPFCCTFCSTKLFWQNKFRLRSLEDLLDEIEYVYNTYHINRFGFDHDLFTSNKSRVVEFCEKLKSRSLPIKWECSSRFDTIDETTISIMKHSGLRKIFFGLESGSERIQNVIKKKIDIHRAMELVKYCLSNDIKVMVSFMYGFPDETLEELEKTLSIIREIQKMGGNIMINVCTFFSGTQMCNDCYSKLYLDEDDNIFQTYFGLRELKSDVINNKEIYVQYYNYPNPIRIQMKYIDIFLHLQYKNSAYAALEQQLLESGKTYIDIYNLFLRSNKERLATVFKKNMGNYKLISSSDYEDFILNMQTEVNKMEYETS